MEVTSERLAELQQQIQYLSKARSLDLNEVVSRIITTTI